MEKQAKAGKHKKETKANQKKKETGQKTKQLSRSKYRIIKHV